MIDILLVLLVFFMSISSTEVLQTNDRRKAARRQGCEGQERIETGGAGQVIVNVLWSAINNGGTHRH